uniref:U11-Saltitoxin-Pre1b_1 n=1 Tax=Phidippus regius TaxID=1905328 RepID=A0A482Z8U6_9ARAC
MINAVSLVLVFFALVAVVLTNEPGNCPGVTDKTCPFEYKINDCCAQADCPAGAVCCVQPCGNVCRRMSPAPIGTPFKDGTECKLGHVGPESWYQKAWNNVFG